jgi:hypothetical protein
VSISRALPQNHHLSIRLQDTSETGTTRSSQLSTQTVSPGVTKRGTRRLISLVVSGFGRWVLTQCARSHLSLPRLEVRAHMAGWFLQDHRQYYLSLLQFYGTDPAVPEVSLLLLLHWLGWGLNMQLSTLSPSCEIALHLSPLLGPPRAQTVRLRVAAWGLCSDEFNSTGHWPPQLYTRETRRMIGDRVFTQNTPLETKCVGNHSIGVGEYTFDSHPAQRYACRNGSDPRCSGAAPPWLAPGEIENRSFAWSEGNVQQSVGP